MWTDKKKTRDSEMSDKEAGVIKQKQNFFQWNSTFLCSLICEKWTRDHLIKQIREILWLRTEQSAISKYRLMKMEKILGNVAEKFKSTNSLRDLIVPFSYCGPVQSTILPSSSIVTYNIVDCQLLHRHHNNPYAHSGGPYNGPPTPTVMMMSLKDLFVLSWRRLIAMGRVVSGRAQTARTFGLPTCLIISLLLSITRLISNLFMWVVYTCDLKFIVWRSHCDPLVPCKLFGSFWQEGLRH